MYESQGVEFDVVCIVGITEHMFDIQSDSRIPPELIHEIKKIYKDLFYVALTRAMQELYIFGSCTTKESIKFLI